VILEYAIYHGPLPFVRELLELGADPNYQDHAGFPALIAALSTDRPDRSQLIELLDAGADIEARGIHDRTPLHYAAATTTSSRSNSCSRTAPTRTCAPGSTTAPRYSGKPRSSAARKPHGRCASSRQAERRAPGDFIQSDVAVCRTATSSRTSTAARCPI
jgi:Ankyrin repeats (many copies)